MSDDFVRAPLTPKQKERLRHLEQHAVAAQLAIDASAVVIISIHVTDAGAQFALGATGNLPREVMSVALNMLADALEQAPEDEKVHFHIGDTPTLN